MSRENSVNLPEKQADQFCCPARVPTPCISFPLPQCTFSHHNAILPLQLLLPATITRLIQFFYFIHVKFNQFKQTIYPEKAFRVGLRQV